jgi:hypothetical protein
LITFVLNQASEDDLDTLADAARRRRDALRTIAASAVSESDTLTIRDISPKYLNGLTGTVKTIETIRKKRCAVVTLDQDSTQKLALSSTKYDSLFNQDSHDLPGIPDPAQDVPIRPLTNLSHTTPG